MKTRSGKFNRRISLLFIMIFTFFLQACMTVPEKEPARPASAQAIAAGNIENGRYLFMGKVHFQNDGPPCMGCHSVGQNGLLGGGAMGPDLTNVSTRRNRDEIVSILANSGAAISPVMQPIFLDYPLSESEQADLIAFLDASAGQPETNMEVWVLGISLVGFVVVVALLGFIYRGRLRGVRKVLVNKVQK